MYRFRKERDVFLTVAVFNHPSGWAYSRVAPFLQSFVQHLRACHSWQIPGVPVSDDDYSLARSRTSPLSSRASEQYHSLMGLLRKQHEVTSPFQS